VFESRLRVGFVVVDLAVIAMSLRTGLVYELTTATGWRWRRATFERIQVRGGRRLLHHVAIAADRWIVSCCLRRPSRRHRGTPTPNPVDVIDVDSGRTMRREALASSSLTQDC